MIDERLNKLLKWNEWKLSTIRWNDVTILWKEHSDKQIYADKQHNWLQLVEQQLQFIQSKMQAIICSLESKK